MKAVLIDSDKSLYWSEVSDPVLKPGHVIVKVRAAGVNRADLLQAAGKYPPPPGWPEWPGLECSGEIAEAAPESRWRVGDKVCALLGGGGYAEKALVPEGMVMPIPAGVSMTAAAALPEVYATALLNLEVLGELQKGETLFVQAGASGLGIAAIQIGKLFGAKVVTTVGSPEKAAAVRSLGADVVINRKCEAVDEVLMQNPPDVALDCAGGRLLGKCLAAMNPGGRWILISTLGGEVTELPLRVVLKKHLRIIGSTLRSRSEAEKGALLRRLVARCWGHFADGALRPVIDREFPMERAAEAHRVLAEQKNIGKVVLTLP
ncbi:MAG: NAD(P)H-quinone oxidoreductase [Lentisphaeria bacterium]|nr:NAD(P)H-quinone oxidoreductase [Lentisphaeria bacterium]